MFLNLVLVLFFIMDSIGNTASYLQMVNGLNPKRQKYIVIREMLIALAAMILFSYIGEFIFSELNLSEATVRVASGVILFLIALKILFPSPTSLRANLPKEEPFIVPLAIPLIAGPSLLATIMLFARLEPSQVRLLSAIFIAWAISVGVLWNAPRLHRLIGNNGLIACERLTGMILILLAVQRFLEGIAEFIPLYCQKG